MLELHHANLVFFIVVDESVRGSKYSVVIAAGGIEYEFGDIVVCIEVFDCFFLVSQELRIPDLRMNIGASLFSANQSFRTRVPDLIDQLRSLYLLF